MNSLSVWAWMFLFGHLLWATGFMFLISWRGFQLGGNPTLFLRIS